MSVVFLDTTTALDKAEGVWGPGSRPEARPHGGASGVPPAGAGVPAGGGRGRQARHGAQRRMGAGHGAGHLGPGSLVLGGGQRDYVHVYATGRPFVRVLPPQTLQ